MEGGAQAGRAALTLARTPCYKPAVSRDPMPSPSTDPRSPPASARFSLYIFDLDGTLVDSRADLAASINVARVSLGLGPLPEETIEGYVGEGLARLIDRAMGPEAAHLHDEAARLFRAHYAEHLLDHTRAYDGVVGLLASLHEGGAPLTVATNKPEVFARAILRGLGLERFLLDVVGGDTLAARKPDPLPLLHLCERFGVAPSRALMVGDSRIDALAAHGAQMPLCAVSWGIGRREDLETHAPAYWAHHPRDVLRAAPRAAS
jgi:phosphoglycolate phosphatase